MRRNTLFHRLLMASCVCAWSIAAAFPQEKAPKAVQVHVVITDEAQREHSELLALRQDDVKVKQGKTFLQVTQLIPARGDSATLQLFILIDDALDPRVGNNLNGEVLIVTDGIDRLRG